MKKPEHIDMRGLLSFHIAWILGQRRMYGEELIEELGRRRDDEPSPGTLYPAIKKLKEDGLVEDERKGRRVVYGLTARGRREVETAADYFRKVYGEVIEKPGALARTHSYVPELKRSTEADELEIDYI